MLNTLINFTLLVPLVRLLAGQKPATGIRFAATLYILTLALLWLLIGWQHLSQHPYSPRPPTAAFN